jgi:hypothetical protein
MEQLPLCIWELLHLGTVACHPASLAGTHMTDNHTNPDVVLLGAGRRCPFAQRITQHTWYAGTMCTSTMKFASSVTQIGAESKPNTMLAGTSLPSAA